MSLIQIIFYFFIFHISNQFNFDFSNIKDLCSEFETMTIDGVVYLTNFLINQSKINNEIEDINKNTSILQLYQYYWENKSLLIEKIKNSSLHNLNFTILKKEYLKLRFNIREKINNTITESFKNFIQNQPREYKIRWVINMENYQIKNGSIKAKFGGIVDYVNFKSNEFLEEMILNSVKENNMTFDIFEEQIIGLRKEIRSVVLYIGNEKNKNYLKQMYLRIYKFKIDRGGNDFIYNKIDEYLKNEDEKYLSSQLQYIIFGEMRDLTEIDFFIDKIEYSGHRLIDCNQELEKSEEEDLKNMALYSERIHKIAFNETKSFSYLDEYVNKIPNEYLKLYINKTINEIPELNDFSRFKHIENREREDILRNILSLINTLSHDAILRMMINLFHIEKESIFNDDEFMDNIFFNSNSEIQNFFSKKIKEYSYLKDFEMFLFKAEPNHFYTDMFYKYRKKFPEYILKEILTALSDYCYDKPPIIRFENINLMKKKQLLENIESILNTHYELKNFEKFYSITKHIKGMNCYANFADFIIVHSNEELRKWVYKLQNYVKKKNNYENIYYRLDFDMCNPHTCLNDIDKENILNTIFLYQELYPELRNYSIFINVIGKSKFQNKIEKLNITEIRNYAKKLYQYYSIKSYRIKPYTEQFFSNKTFIDYINETDDIDSLKLFINRVVVIYPELQIDGILKEVLNSTLFNETLTNDELEKFLNNYSEDIESLKTILYALLRYSNGTNNKEFFIPEDKNFADLKVEFIKIFLQNKFLNTSWNFVRLLNGNNDLLYGGLLSLLSRLNDKQLTKIAIFYKKKFDFIEFEKYSNGLKIMVLFDILNSEEIDKDELFEIIEFNKLLPIDLKGIPKYKLIQYALICEYYVRENNEISKYGSIYNNLYTITRQEIEDYINSTYNKIPSNIKTVEDFDMYANYLEFDKKEINVEIYSY